MLDTTTVHLSEIINSIQIGYAAGKQGEIAKSTHESICNVFNSSEKILNEFYECILRDQGFKEFVEGQMKRAVNNPVLNTLTEDDFRLSMKLYLSAYYKDHTRKIFDFEPKEQDGEGPHFDNNNISLN